LLSIGGLADFEDLIFRTVRLLETDSTIQDRYKGRFSHIFIDEYQDINAGQYRLVRLLAGSDASICIIGDPDQSIYGFRGSDIDCFKWFMRDFPQTKTIFLGRNYRSSQTILDVSAQVIDHNPDWQEIGQRQTIYSHLSGDPTIHLVETSTAKAEAVAIGKTIEQMVGGTGFFSLDSGAVDGHVENEALGFADVAVLFRTRSQGQLIARTLEQAGIPCQVADRQTIMDHTGVKALMSMVKLIHGIGLFTDLHAVASVLRPSLTAGMLEIFRLWAYRNDLSVSQALVQARRVPIHRMGRARQQRLYAFTTWLFDLGKKIKGMSTADTIGALLDDAGIADRFAQDSTFASGYRQLIETAGLYPDDPIGYAAATTLCSHTDIYHHNVEKVALMTMHAAKGLEFEYVFIAGCEAEWIPYHSTIRPANPEEERRLFYVAMTRAKQRLFLTRAKRRRVNGQMRPRQWSPFVNDIDLRYKQMSLQSGKKGTRPVQQQLDLF
jgi:superfamily I DNA/RNA helicase